MHEIDLKDSFKLNDISDKTMNGKYDNILKLVAEDLLKVINAAPCQNECCYIVKQYDCFNEKNVINYRNKTAIYDYLRTIRLCQDGKKHITAIDAPKQYHSLFEKLDIKFVSQNPKIFSTFQGYRYIQVDEIDQSKIDQFLGLVKDTFSAKDEQIYEYLLNWIAQIKQNVGKKTETVLILQGLQDIGKNVFTNVLCELLARYSSKMLLTSIAWQANSMLLLKIRCR
ncbi:MAG: hypothetical protein EZS28_002900 [Streblomastix strix]|uniref:Uncharacterized protein n=1 Tax=Streblomastix strix TaxID=222440 RepID=A0A5J4X2Y6_9EUKA|nr:MAG: hypothetical protein EZS28_002895 [Streblomastix strix]KAA6401578.1 MAG: hypothetical protein EZS28_002900 [Streblomastix strix]